MVIRENFDLKEYNTFGISVLCKYFIEVDQEEELLDLVATYEWNPQEVLILGGGSNFLFTENFEGTVFYPSMKGIEVLREDDDSVYIRVGAGEVWDEWVAWAVEHGYGGIENLSGIPGHVGAAPVQNVGAYGMEAGDTIYEVEAIELDRGQFVCLSAADCQFGYRDSMFKNNGKNRYLITRVVFRLAKEPVFRLEYGTICQELKAAGEEISLKTIRRTIIRIRQNKLPDVSHMPSAGSFFKNPVVAQEMATKLLLKYPELPVYRIDEERCKIAAAWLIEQCGWKGKKVGKVGVYEKQALVIVNHGGASGTEIAHLANEIKKSVFVKFGIWIEPEVNII